MSRTIDRITAGLGQAWVVALATISIVGWALSGWFLNFSDHWQLAMQSATAAITFLMVFCVQHTQSRDDSAMQAKLDELIRAVDAARNDVIGIERGGHGEIRSLRKQLSEED
jgi:low affinity Fe/Cu permease